MFRRRFDEPGRVGYYCRLHVIAASLDVHRILLDESPDAAGPGRARDLTGRAAAEPGTEVEVEADTGSGFVHAAMATVETDGVFHIGITPRVTTTYRAVLGSEASPPVTFVVLDRRVSVSARARGRRTVVRARVTPPSPHASVVLQLRLAHRFGWWPVARTHLDHSSRARFAIARGRRHKARVVLTLPDGATVTRLEPHVLGRPAVGGAFAKGLPAMRAGTVLHNRRPASALVPTWTEAEHLSQRTASKRATPSCTPVVRCRTRSPSCSRTSAGCWKPCAEPRPQLGRSNPSEPDATPLYSTQLGPRRGHPEQLLSRRSSRSAPYSAHREFAA